MAPEKKWVGDLRLKAQSYLCIMFLSKKPSRAAIFLQRVKGNEQSLLITLLRVGRQGCGLAFFRINSTVFC